MEPITLWCTRRWRRRRRRRWRCRWPSKQLSAVVESPSVILIIIPASEVCFGHDFSVQIYFPRAWYAEVLVASTSNRQTGLLIVVVIVDEWWKRSVLLDYRLLSLQRRTRFSFICWQTIGVILIIFQMYLVWIGKLHFQVSRLADHLRSKSSRGEDLQLLLFFVWISYVWHFMLWQMLMCFHIYNN